MITTKQLNNDLIAMERQRLIRKAGYEYNRAGDPEQRYELTKVTRDSGRMNWSISRTQIGRRWNDLDMASQRMDFVATSKKPDLEDSGSIRTGPAGHAFLFSEAEQRYWLEQARLHLSDPEMLKEAENYATQQKLEVRQPSPLAALGHWSSLGSGFVWKVVQLSHPLDGSTYSVNQRKVGYAVDYHATSQYVHCSERSLINYFHNPARIYAVATRSDTLENTVPKALFIVCIYVNLS